MKEREKILLKDLELGARVFIRVGEGACKGIAPSVDYLIKDQILRTISKI